MNVVRTESPPAVEGDPLAAKIEKQAFIRLQWMRNAEGGQRYGNREIIVPANNDDYLKLIRPLLGANTVAPPDIDAHDAQFGDTFLRLISREGNGPWGLFKIGNTDDLAQWAKYNNNPMIRKWVIRVESFDSVEAVLHGLRSDTEGAAWRAETREEQDGLIRRASAVFGDPPRFDRALVEAVANLTGLDQRKVERFLKEDLALDAPIGEGAQGHDESDDQDVPGLD